MPSELKTIRSSEDRYLLPKTGRIILTPDGVLEVRHDDGRLANRLWCTAGGLACENEVTLVQLDDPPKLRLLNVGRSLPRAALGCISFNVLRHVTQDIQEEVAFIKGAMAEDVETMDDYRGQYEMRVRAENAQEPILAAIWSDAYTLAELGVRVLRSYFKNPVPNLWKWQ